VIRLNWQDDHSRFYQLKKPGIQNLKFCKSAVTGQPNRGEQP